MISLKKHERFLYTLLSIYTLLVMIFMLLLNGFFVKPKAFTDGFSYTLSGITHIKSDNLDFSSSRTYTSSGRTTNIFYKDQELTDLINEHLETGQACILISFGYHNRNEHSSGTLSYTDQNYNPNQKAFTYTNFNSMSKGDYIYDYLVSKGVTLPEYYYPIQCSYFIIGEHGDYVTNISLDTDIEYVDNPQDLYDYLINGNDDVIKVGDPDEPEVDSQIPTPQKVAIYKNSDSPTLVWANPKGVSGNNTVGVEIEWKPTLVLTQNLYDVRTIISNDYIDLYKGELLDYNSYCVLLNRDSSPPNVLNSYNTLYDSKPIYSGYNDNYTEDWTDYLIDLNGITNVQRINPLEPSNIFASGTYSGTRVPELSYRIRYYTNTGVSDWVYSGRTYDSDNVSGPSQHSSTHFKNASGDPVSNPTYTPNNDNKVIPQNEIDDQNNPDKQKSNSIFDFISGFFDTIISAISSIFDKLKELVDSISNGTGSFFSFFADMFGAFPQLLGIFLLGLVVTVLLRVLGR